MKINVLPPDINTSFTNFTVTEDGNIRFGLMAIKNVGKAALENIIETRKQGKFKSIFDLCQRVDSRVVNKKVIESLIKSGAMDSFNLRRAQMVAVLDRVLNKTNKRRDPSQLVLFSDAPDETVPDVEEWPLLEILNFEKTLLGIYLTGHPMHFYSGVIDYIKREKISNFYEKQKSQDVIICGVVEKIKNITTRKRGERMAIIKIEDETANIEAFVFPRLYEECSLYLREKAVLVLSGRVEAKERVPKILASKIIPIEKIMDNIREMNISVDKNNLALDKLKKIFVSNKGTTPVFFSFKDSKLQGVKVKTANKFCIALSQQALEDVGSVVGKSNLSLTL